IDYRAGPIPGAHFSRGADLHPAPAAPPRRDPRPRRAGCGRGTCPVRAHAGRGHGGILARGGPTTRPTGREAVWLTKRRRDCAMADLLASAREVQSAYEAVVAPLRLARFPTPVDVANLRRLAADHESHVAPLRPRLVQVSHGSIGGRLVESAHADLIA